MLRRIFKGKQLNLKKTKLILKRHFSQIKQMKILERSKKKTKTKMKMVNKIVGGEDSDDYA